MTRRPRPTCSPTTAIWRDLVAFTWNIKTVEGPAGVQDMLDATLANVQPQRLADQ